MKRINLVFEYDYDDVDILLVPNIVHDNIDVVVQNFFDYCKTIELSNNKKEALVIGTEEFIDWLNENYFSHEKERSSILKTHVKYCPEYPIADF